MFFSCVWNVFRLGNSRDEDYFARRCFERVSDVPHGCRQSCGPHGGARLWNAIGKRGNKNVDFLRPSPSSHSYSNRYYSIIILLFFFFFFAFHRVPWCTLPVSLLLSCPKWWHRSKESMKMNRETAKCWPLLAPSVSRAISELPLEVCRLFLKRQFLDSQ